MKFIISNLMFFYHWWKNLFKNTNNCFLVESFDAGRHGLKSAQLWLAHVNPLVYVMSHNIILENLILRNLTNIIFQLLLWQIYLFSFFSKFKQSHLPIKQVKINLLGFLEIRLKVISIRKYTWSDIDIWSEFIWLLWRKPWNMHKYQP